MNLLIMIGEGQLALYWPHTTTMKEITIQFSLGLGVHCQRFVEIPPEWNTVKTTVISHFRK